MSKSAGEIEGDVPGIGLPADPVPGMPEPAEGRAALSAGARNVGGQSLLETPAGLEASQNSAAHGLLTEGQVLSTADIPELSEVPPESLDQLLQSLVRLARLLRGVEIGLDEPIESMLALAQRDVVGLTFGGHFKSGKSTIMNAALHRLILPIDDLPETGAICILKSGPTDSALVIDRQGSRAIPFDTESIRRETSLISDSGERRAQVHDVDRVELTLVDSIIPANARWLDSPGIDDTPEMTDRAWRAARTADLLVWIISSRQPLSEVEMEFLSRYIGERGPASVVFLVNAFLSKDDLLEWHSFLGTKLPRLVSKIRDHARGMGFPLDCFPPVVPIAGRALCGTEEPRFGRRGLQRLLTRFDSRRNPRIQRSRLYRLAAQLREFREQLERKRAEFSALEDCAGGAGHGQPDSGAISGAPLSGGPLSGGNERNAAGPSETSAGNASSPGVVSGAINAAINGAIQGFLDRFAGRARQIGAGVAADINADNLRRDAFYSEELTRRLRALAEAESGFLAEELQRTAMHPDQTQAKPELGVALEALLVPPELVVMVPWSGIGKVSGASGARAISKFIQRDAEMARWNVGYASEQAITALCMRRDKIAAFLSENLSNYLDNDLAEPQAASGGSEGQAERLSQAVDEVSRLADLAAALAQPR